MGWGKEQKGSLVSRAVGGGGWGEMESGGDEETTKQVVFLEDATWFGL